MHFKLNLEIKIGGQKLGSGGGGGEERERKVVRIDTHGHLS